MNKKWLKVGIGLIILIILVGGYLCFSSYFLHKKSNLRQAVFLSNGQVYFGYVANPGKQIVKIREIYYLKTQDSLQPNNDPGANKKISLVKLGNELHGPTDEMLINRDQILFIESMRQDSKINQAIERFISQGESAKSD